MELQTLWQILVDGFAISALYALGATGFTLIFGVSGVLNLSHGALMVTAVYAAWVAGANFGFGHYLGALIGVAVGAAGAMLTYFVVVRPFQSGKLNLAHALLALAFIAWLALDPNLGRFLGVTSKVLIALAIGLLGYLMTRQPLPIYRIREQ